MGSCREILTLQLGDYANFVGTHLWSIQEMGFDYTATSEICHDVLFREGLTRQGAVTFTPRVLCVQRTSLQAPIPTLDEPPNAVPGPVLWDEARVDRVDVPADSLHPFIQDLDAGVDTTGKDYAFDSSVRGWGDLLRTRLHPRSIVAGYEKLEDDLEDRIRAYVEECDNIQGFHILIDSSESYPEVLTFLDDEFASKTRVAFPVVAGVEALPLRDAATRLVRTFISLQETSSLASLSVPLSCVSQLSLKPERATVFPDLSFNLQSNYHTSAILASFLDTFSLAYRTKANASDMSDVVAGLTTRGWKFAAASLALPFPLLPSTTLQQSLEARSDELPLWSGLTPGAALDNAWYQSLALRGVPDNNVLLQYLNYLSSTVTAVQSVLAPLPTLSPFPRIFSQHVSMRGSVDPVACRMPDFHVNSTPALAGLHACPGLGKMIENVTGMVSKIDLRRLPLIDIEKDLMTESINSMTALSQVHSLHFDID